MVLRRLALLSLVVGLLAAPALRAQSGPPPRSAYASRCGSEIAWMEDLDAALARAAEEKKPVFWFVPTARGTKMDRKQELYWYMMGGAFMDPAMVGLINERFVPLRLGFSRLLGRRGERMIATVDRATSAEIAARYGLAVFEFVEPGFLLLDPKGARVASFDRLSVYNSRWMMDRLGRVLKEHAEALGSAAAPIPETAPRPALAAAHALLRAGKYRDAHEAFQKVVVGPETSESDRAECLYFMGACLHRLARNEEGDAIWGKLVKKHADDRWGWKGKLELERWGPFIHGFEVYRDLPAASFSAPVAEGTRTPGRAEDAREMAARGLDLLLLLQRENGSWDDSRYDFGGIDSLPNVHVAVTALAATAVLAWREADPARADAAVSRATRFLLDEKNVNAEDSDELVWAHVYRLRFLDALAAARPELAERARKKTAEILAELEKMPRRRGAWAHEYPNPFATASVIEAMCSARTHGAKVKKVLLDEAAAALRSSRSEEGHFGYGVSTRGATPEFSVGRTPLCELALYLTSEEGKGDAAALERAVEHGFAKHDILENVRKYDDHADRYNNGGFFFWYGVHGLAMAVEAAPVKAEKKTAWRKRCVELVTAIGEADGGWIDSHELGKSYGTAMALIVLDLALEPAKQ
ncbi:MAG: hypothetical protein R3F20_12070 [Planctomycetota bacterium]